MRRRHHLLGHDVQPLTVLAAFLILGAAIAVAARADGAWWAIPAGIIAPDLTFLVAGAQKPPASGLMPHRAIRFYNAAHHPLVAVAGLTVTAALGFNTGIVFAIAWISHIVWDRSVGYTLRDKNGATKTHRTATEVTEPGCAENQVIEGSAFGTSLAVGNDDARSPARPLPVTPRARF